MRRTFERSFDALPDVFAATAAFYDEHAIAERHRFAVDFAIEEIFTNMVKYHPESAEAIEVGLRCEEGRRLIVTLIDRDVERYDVRDSPVPDVDAPLEQRRPGGLGLLLTRKVMATVDYEYDNRTSRVTMARELD